MNKIKRRDFLKLIAVIPPGMFLSKLLPLSGKSSSNSPHPHIIIIVLDALTARNMSLHGYPRETTPNIDRFSSRANVYHSHYSAGTYTTPGVASLLTGTYPWTHSAINLSGLVSREIEHRNIFHLLESQYNRVGFTQNYYANYILSQFGNNIEHHLPLQSFSKIEQYLTNVEHKDHLLKFRALDDFLFRDSPSPGSLVLGTLNKYRREYNFQTHLQDYNQHSGNTLIFDINHVFTNLASQTVDLELPSFCYFHLLPPHSPYIPKQKYRYLFRDDWKPQAKPHHPLVERVNTSENTLNIKRLLYDQFIATTDAAFGKFLRKIEEAGLLEQSYVILTSDHGESFERGYLGHSESLIYEPSIHVPLIISSPGQTIRRDFYSVTNSVDLLPTILKISKQAVPKWVEGSILPGFGGTNNNTRVTFSMDAKLGSTFSTLSPITIAMFQGDYKLIYYKGYGKNNSPYHNGLFELYNLKDDPEELQNLIDDKVNIANQMKERLLKDYKSANQPFEK